MTADEADIDLGNTATVNTDDGKVLVDGNPIMMRSTIASQTSAPNIRIFIVHSMRAANVTISGGNAVAIVSHGDLTINGTFTASGGNTIVAPGAFNNSTCRGTQGVLGTGAFPGSGGGGFGGSGGAGGSTTNTSDTGTAAGGVGGMPTGNPELVPLRGGCDSGGYLSNSAAFGAGGGAVQLVSRTKIVVLGVVAANGGSLSGGGSGGGILLEAPVVNVPGNVVANGGSGAGGCLLAMGGEDGHLNATAAAGGNPCNTSIGATGGYGGARDLVDAGTGANFNGLTLGLRQVFAGHGGGGVGRIRVNTIAGGLHAGGIFSPNPSTGTLATR